MNRPNRVIEYIALVWPRIWGKQSVALANMDVPHAIGRPIMAAQITSPLRFPGVKPQRTDSVVTVQSRLRGLPYFEAARIEEVRRLTLNMRVRTQAVSTHPIEASNGR